jgi:hypothetical protein
MFRINCRTFAGEPLGMVEDSGKIPLSFDSRDSAWRWLDLHARVGGLSYNVVEIPEWTALTFRCESCKRVARLSTVSLEAARRDVDSDATDEQIAGECFDFCLSCLAGEIVPGEHVMGDEVVTNG